MFKVFKATVRTATMPARRLFLEFCYAVFPVCRWLYRGLGFEFEAQDFTQGQLKEDVTLADFRQYLHELGFERARLAWVCKNEVLNLRKRLKDGTQYHIRVFTDGTVNGHHEWAPEFAPLRHWYQLHLRPERGFFKKALGSFLIFK